MKLNLFLSSLALLCMSTPAYAQTKSAVPAGMTLAWGDEFNGTKLDTARWSSQYYSTLDYVARTNYEQMQNGTLPEAAYRFTGHSIVLLTNDTLPKENYWEPRRKVSSIQTYDWRENRFKTGGDEVGGYLEARIRRTVSKEAKGVNGAFWIDSPGPDARYFVEAGDSALGVQGIRPRGQVFEIDFCEGTNTELVLHGFVSPQGEFQHNIAYYPLLSTSTDRWITHSMLWTPRGLKFYIDGKLVQTDWNPQHIKSPNHAMNVFLGMYNKAGSSATEVDYIRFYHWKLEVGNSVPNSSFEYSNALFPWEGKGTVSTLSPRTGHQCVMLHPGQHIEQYIYLDNTTNYKLSYWSRGTGMLKGCIENLKQVSGTVENSSERQTASSTAYVETTLPFATGAEYGTHKKTVRLSFTNTGSAPVYLDDVCISKE
jgi:hypothetical protein